MKRNWLAVAGLALLVAQALAAQDAEVPVTEDGATDITVVTPGGSERKLMDTPDSVNVLEGRRLTERMGGQTPDLLEGATGVYVQHTGAGQGSPFLRGRTGKEILLLVNGVRFNTSTFRSGPNQYYSSIDPDSIERIEVIRGPSSVLYGSDALGGVINIILKSPSYQDFEYSFGARGRFQSADRRKQGGLFGEIGTRNFGAVVNAGYADVDELVGGSSIGRQPFTAYEEWGAFGSFGARFGEHTITLSYSHFQQNDLNRTDAVSGMVPNQAVLPAPGVGQDLRRLFEWQVDDFALAEWRWETGGLLREMFVDLSYHKQQETQERIRRSSANRLEDSNFNTHSFGLKMQAVLDFAEWAVLTVGAEANYDTVHTRSADINRTTDVQKNIDGRVQFPDWSNYASFGIYAQNETALLDEALLVRYGVRYSGFRAQSDVDTRYAQLDGINAFFSDITGAVAVVGRPMDELSLTLNLARGFRAPNLDDLAASKAFGSGAQFPNPDVDPETQYSVDVGARLLIPATDSKSAAPYELMAHAVFFFNYLEDTLVNRPTTLDSVNGYRQENWGRSRIFGVEAEAGFYLSQALGWLGLPTDHVFFEGDALGVHGNFTWTRGDNLKDEEPLNRIPPAFAEISVRYEMLHGQVFLEQYTTIVGRQDQYGPQAATDPRFTPGDAPGYVLFGMRAGWYPCRHARLNLNIQNIGNRSYHPMGGGTYGSGTNVILSGEVRW